MLDVMDDGGKVAGGKASPASVRHVEGRQEEEGSFRWILGAHFRLQQLIKELFGVGWGAEQGERSVRCVLKLSWTIASSQECTPAFSRSVRTTASVFGVSSRGMRFGVSVPGSTHLGVGQVVGVVCSTSWLARLLKRHLARKLVHVHFEVDGGGPQVVGRVDLAAGAANAAGTGAAGAKASQTAFAVLVQRMDGMARSTLPEAGRHGSQRAPHAQRSART